MADERVDITIFGATGYTGKVVIREFIKFNRNHQLSWAIAGRNAEKLSQALNWATRKSGNNISAVRVIIADCEDEESLNDMAKQAKIVINCCGPYSYYGESVVKACIQNGTHHVDVSGEPEFMERMQLEYHEAAEKQEAYIVSACGFESVAADLGVIHLMKNFPGVVNSVESYAECTGEMREPGVNITTFECLVNGIATIDKLEPIRNKLNSKFDKIKLEPPLRTRSLIHINSVFDSYKPNVWFLGPDKSVVLRSQQMLRKIYKKRMRPVQFEPYLVVQPLVLLLAMMIIGFFLSVLTRFSLGRKLLMKYPEIFTLGIVTKTGPSEEACSKSSAKIRFVGKGWTKDVSLKYDDPVLIKEPTNTRIVTEISFNDVGYGFTARAAIISAVTILNDSKRMPLKGGVFTPGAAFAKTNFLENLAQLDVSMKVISNS